MMRWQRPGVLAVLTAALLALLAAPSFAEEKKANEGAADAPAIGKAAPDFNLKDLGGKDVKLADFKGKIVVLQFQSMNCPWDKGYQPILDKMAQGYHKHDADGKDAGKVVFLAINANQSESADALKKYHESVKMAYPILKDPGNKVADAYHAATTPHIYVIDEKGVLRYKGGVEKAPASEGEIGKSKEQYLGPVLEALTQGKEPPFTSTKSHGCSIKREKKG